LSGLVKGDAAIEEIALVGDVEGHEIIFAGGGIGCNGMRGGGGALPGRRGSG
jgi:hypothetical protein